MDDATKRIAAPGMAAMLLLCEIVARLIRMRVISPTDAREAADAALLAAEKQFGATTDPVYGAAVRACLESCLRDLTQPTQPPRPDA